ncbi:MAG: FlgD immunoglobulin-like domain containing protein [Candidatus Krumholzibacteria bacterium]|nr:FlgD immunoglobulin-like domain containing protein [Candidatus Krumholzibacteria bacterium]
MKTMRTLSALLLLTVVLLAGNMGEALAGANETPGRGFKPHCFGSYSTNLFEFGGTDIGIFKTYVTGLQHYAQGAAYSDATLDLTSGGAGISNFFTFCTDKKHDVMLVTAHGINAPATLIEQYIKTPAGLAARDSVFTYWNGILAAGSIQKGNWAGYYSIDATQAFYTNYFQTPQAFAWWATCWSSLLSMTASTEARCYLGYNQVVASSKCYCDERDILKKMNGFSGQALRPLGPAYAGINGRCTPGGANLIAQGKLNTTLSPSVTGNAPQHIVCEFTPGFVSFDTSLDVTRPPSSVVVASGDGLLINHQWIGDDFIIFDVLPLVPTPFIVYNVIENMARSKANIARLDGNTDPPVNALGPNRDDYVWYTFCPSGVPSLNVLDPICVVPVISGDSVTVVTPVGNNSLDQNLTVTMTLEDELGWYNGGPLVLNIPAGEALIPEWELYVPPMLPSEVTNPIFIFAEASDSILGFATEELVVRPSVGATFASSAYGHPLEVQPTPLDIRIENFTESTLNFENVIYESDSGAGWQVFPEDPEFATIGPREVFYDQIYFMPPEGALPGDSAPLVFSAEINGNPTQIQVGELKVGVPIEIVVLELVGFVPGNSSASMTFSLTNNTTSIGLFDLNVEANNSLGLPTDVLVPPFIEAGETVACSLFVAIPNDPELVGLTGTIDLNFFDCCGFNFEESLNFIISPAVEIIPLFLGVSFPLITGGSQAESFPLPCTLVNRSEVDLVCHLETDSPEVPLVPIEIVEIVLSSETPYEVPVRAILPVNTAPGRYQAEIRVSSNDEGPRGIGDTTFEFEIEVSNPVVVDMHSRGAAGEAGETVIVGATIHNLREDAPMSGAYEWSDERDWLLGDLIGSYNLPPGGSDSLVVELLLPLNFSAAADSDSVTLRADMVYDSGSTSESWASIRVIVLADSLTSVPEDGVPTLERLESVYPNPFNPQTRILFHLVEAGRIEIAVVDIEGRRIRVLEKGEREAGSHEIEWDGRDGDGRTVASGVYFVVLTTRDGRHSSKAILLK